MRLAYADPPYIGQAKKHYNHDPRCAEVDHEQLIKDLCTYDGWALSLSTSSLKQIAAYCPDNVRFGAWVKPFCAFKKNVTVAYAWEPVIFVPARKRPVTLPTVRDWWLEESPCVKENITLKKGLCGVKPERFSLWLFDILGAEAEDEFCDLFPGSGAVSAAWDKFVNEKIAAKGD